jgi:hypothetical protein
VIAPHRAAVAPGFYDRIRRHRGGRADAIKTDTNGLDAGDAKVKVSDGEMPAYLARPAG